MGGRCRDFQEILVIRRLVYLWLLAYARASLFLVIPTLLSSLLWILRPRKLQLPIPVGGSGRLKLASIGFNCFAPRMK